MGEGKNLDGQEEKKQREVNIFSRRPGAGDAWEDISARRSRFPPLGPCNRFHSRTGNTQLL